MSEQYKCNICGAPATVHLTQIVDGKIHKVHLCEKCAAKSKVAELPILKFTEMLAKTLAAGGKKSEQEIPSEELAGREPNKICPVCGMTDVTFDKNRLFGCAHCYEIFSEEVSSLLPKIQRGRDYRGDAGKKPVVNRSSPAETGKPVERASLKARLKEAVEQEDYALAATLRDALRALDTPKKTLKVSKKKSSKAVSETPKSKLRRNASRPKKSSKGEEK